MALRLSLGIALASGAPLFSGLLTGIIGGLYGLINIQLAEEVSFLKKDAVEYTLNHLPDELDVILTAIGCDS